MNFITTLGKIFQKPFHVVADALFPLSKAEEELLSLSPKEAFAKLPTAPSYDASVVPLPGTRSIFTYKDERVSKLVWSIKYKKSPQAVKIGGFALFQTLKKLTESIPVASAPSKIIIVPIPITPRRRRERGYNQCELLLNEIQILDVGKIFRYEKNLLERVQHKERQTLKSRGERLQGSKGIFEVNKEVAQRIKNYKGEPPVDHFFDPLIVVIDDVITTGSTMKEALDTLKLAGFANVAGLSLAH